MSDLKELLSIVRRALPSHGTRSEDAINAYAALEAEIERLQQANGQLTADLMGCRDGALVRDLRTALGHAERDRASALQDYMACDARLLAAERQRDEAIAERNALLKLITDHNADLARICDLQPCEAFRGRGRNCPSCPRGHAVELPEFAIFLHEAARSADEQPKYSY